MEEQTFVDQNAWRWKPKVIEIPDKIWINSRDGGVHKGQMPYVKTFLEVVQNDVESFVMLDSAKGKILPADMMSPFIDLLSMMTMYEIHSIDDDWIWRNEDKPSECLMVCGQSKLLDFTKFTIEKELLALIAAEGKSGHVTHLIRERMREGFVNAHQRASEKAQFMSQQRRDNREKAIEEFIKQYDKTTDDLTSDSLKHIMDATRILTTDTQDLLKESEQTNEREKESHHQLDQ